MVQKAVDQALKENLDTKLSAKTDSNHYCDNGNHD